MKKWALSDSMPVFFGKAMSGPSSRAGEAMTTPNRPVGGSFGKFLDDVLAPLAAFLRKEAAVRHL
jgi:hypothetical protein